MDCLRAKLLTLGELDEARQRQQVDEMVLVEAVDEDLHLLAMHRDRRRCHEHAMLTVEVERLLGGRLHADDWDVVAVAHLADRYRRRRVAGDDDGLDITAHEEVERLLHKALDLICRLDSVRHIVLVRIEDELFLRQHAHRMVQHRKPADTRIKKRNFHCQQPPNRL